MGFIAPIISSTMPILHPKGSQFRTVPLVVHRSTHPHISDIHWHDFTQIWYTVSGSYVHTINGERVVQNAGSVAIVPPYAIHSVDTTGTDFEKADIRYLSLDQDSVLDEGIPFFPLAYNFSTFENFMLRPFVHLTGRDKELCDLLFDGMTRKSEKDAPCSFSVALSNTAAILELCAKHINVCISKSDLASAREQTQLIKNSLEYITHNSYSKVSLAKASKVAMMSERSFTDKFRSCIGQTAHNYLISVRIMHAFRLLRHTDLSISDISEMCGFANSGHFIRLCLRNLDASPSSVRESVKNWDNRYNEDLMHRGEIRSMLNTWSI